MRQFENDPRLQVILDRQNFDVVRGVMATLSVVMPFVLFIEYYGLLEDEGPAVAAFSNWIDGAILGYSILGLFALKHVPSWVRKHSRSILISLLVGLVTTEVTMSTLHTRTPPNMNMLVVILAVGAATIHLRVLPTLGLFPLLVSAVVVFLKNFTQIQAPELIFGSTAATTAIITLSIGRIRNTYLALQLDDEVRKREAAERQGHFDGRMAALGEMASGIAHEVNNPLAIILGTAEVLQKMLAAPQPDLPAALKGLGRITISVFRIRDLVQSMRNLSPSTAPGAPQAVSIQEIMQDLANVIRERYGARGVNLDILEIDPRLHTFGYKPELSQSILQVLNNAFEAAQKGSNPNVTVRVSKSGQNILVNIEDNGPGVNDRDAESIFLPFFSTKLGGKNVGLGLSLASAWAQRNGGRVMLTNLQKPTRFTLEFPIAQANVGTTSKQSAA